MSNKPRIKKPKKPEIPAGAKAFVEDGLLRQSKKLGEIRDLAAMIAESDLDGDAFYDMLEAAAAKVEK